MNKNVDKAITEGNNKGPKINKLTKSIITTTDSKSNSNKYYKNLKFKDKNIPRKKEEKLISKSKIIFCINKLFFNIAQYSSKEKDYFISKYQLMDILKQGNIISPKIISLNQTDIILTKLYPHQTKFNFSQFMNFLTELCQFLYRDNFLANPKNTMDTFLTSLYNNYKDIIIEKNDNNFMEKLDDNSCTLKCLETIISSKLERPIFKLILTLYDNLVKIYKVYFPNEIMEYRSINEEKIREESAQNLIKFWNDFEFYPAIISKANLNMYLYLLMKYLEQKNYINQIIIDFGENDNYTDIGIYFKFSSFILCLYHFCIFYHYKKMKFQFQRNNNKNNDSIQYNESLIDVDKIIFFFTNLENSSGIKKYLLKRARTNEYRFNFIFKKKDIKIARYEMDLGTNDNKDTEKDLIANKNNKKNKLEKLTIESSPYTSRQLTERNIEDEKNDKSKFLTNISFENKNIFSNYNLNKYFLNINKKDNYLITLTDLDEILSISSKVKEEIIMKLEKLSEIFLKYSKINNKLEYNRMSYSSFLKFLEDANLLLGIPKKKKIKYRRLSNDIMSKTLTISTIKKFENSLQFSISCNNITLSKEEVDYKKNVSKIVNTTKKIRNKNKLNVTEASLIFSSVTGSYNFPSYLSQIKNQFSKDDELFNKNKNDFIKKNEFFEPKKEAHFQKDVPNKMNFALFIKSFESIATKLYPKMLLDDAVSMFLDLKIDPFIYQQHRKNDKNDEIKKALEKMDNPEIKLILKKLGDIILPFYTKFADNKNEMQFYQFFDFYINMKLFPEMISLSQMKNIFYILCDINKNKTQTIEKGKNIPDKIDFDSFIKSLGISSMLFNFKDILSDTDRILYIYYFILKSSNMTNINLNKNILKKIQNNLKGKNTKKYFRNSSIDDLNNRKIKLTYDNKTNEFSFVSKTKKTYNFFDIYK